MGSTHVLLRESVLPSLRRVLVVLSDPYGRASDLLWELFERRDLLEQRTVLTLYDQFAYSPVQVAEPSWMFSNAELCGTVQTGVPRIRTDVRSSLRL